MPKKTDDAAFTLQNLRAGGTFHATSEVDYFVYDFEKIKPNKNISIIDFDASEDKIIFENFGNYQLVIDDETPGIHNATYSNAAGDSILVDDESFYLTNQLGSQRINLNGYIDFVDVESYTDVLPGDYIL